MKLDTTFGEIQGTFQLCLKCRECTYGDWPENFRLCPIHNEHQVFTASAGGLIAILLALYQNKLEYNPDIAKLAYECITCGSCDVCEVLPLRPPYNSVTDMIRFLRYQLVKKGLVPEGELCKLYRQIEKLGDYPGEKVNVTPGSQDVKSETVLFAECLHEKGQQDIYQAALKVMNKLGPTVVFGHGGCCGSSLYDLGFWDQLKDLLEKRSKELETLKDKDTIFVNPHCQEFLKKKYPGISKHNIEIKPRHISEVLAEAFKSKRLKTRRGHKIKVSYHDPCYLGKELGIYDAPREVLTSLEGVELVEMPRNRRNSYCCGAGGAAGSKAFPDFSHKVTLNRLQEFKETGADLLVTACPHCKTTFQNILPANEKNRVIDLVELVNERII